MLLDPSSRAQVAESQGLGGVPQALPLSFVENAGQWSTTDRFQARWRGATLGIAPDGFIITIDDAVSHHEQSARVRFHNVHSTARVEGVEADDSLHNYFLGADPARWRSGLPGYAAARIHNLYDGIDLLLRLHDGWLAPEFVLSPGSRPESISFSVEGADESRCVGSRLEMTAGAWTIDWLGLQVCGHAPNGSSRVSRGRPVAFVDGTWGVAVDTPGDGQSDAFAPVLSWSTYLGGSHGDTLGLLTRLPSGSILFGGNSLSADFPVSPGAYDGTKDPGSLTKDGIFGSLSADGTHLEFCTYFGGQSAANDGFMSIGTQSDGDIVGVLWTESLDLPVTASAFQPAHAAGLVDAALVVFDSSGSTLKYASYLGGPKNEIEGSLCVMDDDDVVVALGTFSKTLPATAGAFDSTPDGAKDVYLATFDLDEAPANQIQWAGYLWGLADETLRGLALTPRGDVLVAGLTDLAATFPVTAGAFDPSVPNTWGSFVSRVASDGSTLQTSTLFELGISGIDLFANGDIAIGGSTPTGGLPPAYVTPGAWDTTLNGSADAYVARLRSDFTTLEWLTVFGGSSSESGTAVCVDPDDNAFVMGQTSSANLPLTQFAIDDTFSGGFADAYVAAFASDGSVLLYSTFAGSSGIAAITGTDLEPVAPRTVLVSGFTTAGFPVTSTAFDPTYNGGGDSFVMQLAVPSAWADAGFSLAGVAGPPELMGAGWPTSGTSVTVSLSHAAPASAATLVLGLVAVQLPFKAGVLVPSADVLLGGLVTTPNGDLVLHGAWPPGVPPGFTAWLQTWIVDSAGPSGFSASNAVSVTTP